MEKIENETGIITIGIGEKYILEAMSLAASLKKYSPEIPRAIICNPEEIKPKWNISQFYDFIIPWDPSLGHPYLQKLSLDKYSPFEKTLFLDADCLAVKDISFIFDLFADQTFGYVGLTKEKGEWYNFEISEVIERLNISKLPVFNGGMFYFDSSETSKKILQQSRDFNQKLDEYGVPKFRGTFFPDEPAMAFALGMNGILPTEDNQSTMLSSAGLIGKMKLDVIKGYCNFNKSGTMVNPAIIHCARNKGAHYYTREAVKIRLAVGTKVPLTLIKLYGNYRELKVLVGKFFMKVQNKITKK